MDLLYSKALIFLGNSHTTFAIAYTMLEYLLISYFIVIESEDFLRISWGIEERSELWALVQLSNTTSLSLLKFLRSLNYIDK